MTDRLPGGLPPFKIRKGKDREVGTNLSGTGRHGMGLETLGNRQVQEKTDRQDMGLETLGNRQVQEKNGQAGLY
jgi:hypothetical protein